MINDFNFIKFNFEYSKLVIYKKRARAFGK